MTQSGAITSKMAENRTFPPPAKFVEQANIKSLDEYRRMYEQSIRQPEEFWGKIAEGFHWFKKWDKVRDWKEPDVKWFVGAKTNVSYNCLDLQIEKGRGNHPAILFEGEPGDVRKITFKELRTEVCKFANVLKKLGVKKGDRVTIYMPMIPELPIAMLACARIGAPHSIIFGGFSATAISDRVGDADSHIIITCDGGWRRGKVVPLKATVDEALEIDRRVKQVVVFKRIGEQAKVTMKAGRDFWWHDLMKEASADCPAEQCDAEDPLFLLYTSGSTGKPKGIKHTTAGYMVYTAFTSKMIFDLKPNDLMWCTADIGWVTGHSYVVYGILQNGVTSLIYEGSPDFPNWERFWTMIEKHKPTVFYTAPTAIRAFMKQGRQLVDKHDLSSLRLLGSVGEPINPEAWMWYHEVVGRKSCPIVDTWWQTETGGILITPLPGITDTKPGSATRPFFGVEPDVVDRSGKTVNVNEGGLLVIRQPWPAMLRTVWGDHDRFKRTYWSDIKGCYFTGDGARRDADGYYWLMGRVDDVLNVSGHRLGTAEVESALVAHEAVAEAAVVGMPHEIKGEGIAAFVTLRKGFTASDELKKALDAHVVKEIGAIARPDQIRFSEALPKTRSGKIMRRLLREIAAGGDVKGDTTTLEDFNVINKLRQDDES
ncbi:MAG: Acetyl-coenzyme A synthetase [Phycisphaerae bacterium]|nr:Acetyl-coenzyme A synthetase [Phycisphaerae bacterium]